MERQLRPLLVSTLYPPSLGGAQLHAHELLKALSRAGHRPEVATIWQESRSDWLRGTTVRVPVHPPTRGDLDGITVHRLGIDSRLRSIGVAGAFYPALLTGLGDAAMRRAAASLFEAALDGVVSRVRPNVILLTRIGRAHLYAAALSVARRAGLPVVLTPNHHPSWTRRRDRWWWSLYRQVDALLALTDAEVDLLAAGGVDRQRIHRSTVGIVGQPAEIRTATTPTVAFLGQAHPYKGIDLLHLAWPHVRRAVPDARLEVMGPWIRGRERLRKSLEDLPGVTVYGPVDDATKWRVLSETHVLAVPSAAESLGGVYLEAWAAGAVPVGADIPAVRELLIDAGRVVDRAPEPLAATLIDLLSDAEMRERLVSRGRQRLREGHDWDGIAERTARILSSVRTSVAPRPES